MLRSAWECRQPRSALKTNDLLRALLADPGLGNAPGGATACMAQKKGHGANWSLPASFLTARLGNQAKKLICPPASAGIGGVAPSGSSEAIASAHSSSACSSSSALACFSSLGVYPSSPIRAGVSISKTAVSSEFTGG